MEFKIAFGNADSFITKTYQMIMWICFTRVFQFIMASITIIGFYFFISYFNANVKQFAHVESKWSFIVIAFFVLFITFVLHELAHAYTTKFFNRRVYAFGVGWMWLGPIAFCDTSDMWLSPAKSRIIVDLAGLYLNAFFAGLASLFIPFTFPSSLSIFLWLFSLITYLTIFTNLNPTIRLDGYYTLMDILNKHHLRESATIWLMSLFGKTTDAKPIFQSIREHPAEATYWLVSIFFIICNAIIPYVLLLYFLPGLFGLHHPLINIAISLLIMLCSTLGIIGELVQEHRNLKI